MVINDAGVMVSFFNELLRKMLLLLGACAAIMLAGSPACATDTLDISTGLKTLLLMNDQEPGPVSMAVVYDPASAVSKADAESIKNNVNKGVGVPVGLSINAFLVSSANTAGLSKARVAFLAQDIGSEMDAVCNVATRAGILTLSTDIRCVHANKCVLGIITRPRVEIYYSAIAAEASHIRFSPAFIMLVKQL